MPEELTNEELQQMFMERKRENLKACRSEIDAVLAKHGCRIQPVTVIRDGRIATKIEIVGN